VVDALMKATWGTAMPADANQAAIERAIQSLVVLRLMDVAANERAQPQVRSVASDALRSLLATLKRTPVTGDNGAHFRSTSEDIERFLTRPDAPRKQTRPLVTPPGDPIG